MYAFDRMCRAFAACLLAVAVVAAGPSFAQGKPAKPKHEAMTLPEPLTHDSIRELVSRLSDEDVRKLLVSQLDRAAVPGVDPGQPLALLPVGLNRQRHPLRRPQVSPQCLQHAVLVVVVIITLMGGFHSLLRIAPGLLLLSVVQCPLRQRQAGRDIAEDHAHARADADLSDEFGRREVAVGCGQIPDHA